MLIEEISEEFAELFEYTSEELKGKHVSIIEHEFTPPPTGGWMTHTTGITKSGNLIDFVVRIIECGNLRKGYFFPVCKRLLKENQCGFSPEFVLDRFNKIILANTIFKKFFGNINDISVNKNLLFRTVKLGRYEWQAIGYLRKGNGNHIYFCAHATKEPDCHYLIRLSNVWEFQLNQKKQEYNIMGEKYYMDGKYREDEISKKVKKALYSELIPEDIHPDIEEIAELLDKCDCEVLMNDDNVGTAAKTLPVVDLEKLAKDEEELKWLRLYRLFSKKTKDNFRKRVAVKPE